MKRLLLALPLLTALLGAGPAAASPDNGASTAGQLFQVGAGGRALGMGSAYTAMAQDASSLYYNPAGLGLLDGRQALLMHAQLFGGAAYDYFGYAQNFGKTPGGWGLQVLRLGLGGAEGRDVNNSRSGSFSYGETALGAGFGLRGVLLPDLSLGGGLKFLQRTLGPSSDRMIALDVGAQYGSFWNERLNLGLVVQNAASKSQGETADTLPAVVRAGAALRIAGPLLLSADVSSLGELRVGTEYALGITFLRAGYAPQGLAFGGGIKIRRSLSLDLAVVNNPTLGMSQRVSLGYRFGSRDKRKLGAYASEYLADAQGELDKRHYAQASKDIEAALGVDPEISPDWKRKGRRLRELLGGMEGGGLSAEEGQLLAEQSAAAGLAHKAVVAYLAGQDSEALLLAQVAAGASAKDPAFVKLLQSLAKATQQAIVRDDVIAPALFAQDRSKRAVNAIYLQRYDAAVRACREMLVVNPEDALAWTRLGSAHFASGNKVEARKAYQKALDLEPGNQKLRDFMNQNMKE